MIKPLKIFLSSTYSDLRPERELAQDVIIRLKQQFIGMEFFPASDQTPLEVCLSQIESSDVVILIIGHRYGVVSREFGKSIVELEYEQAIRQKKRVLVFIKADTSLVSAEHFECNPEAIPRLHEFKANLKNHYHVSFFHTPEQLAIEITYSLYPIVSDLIAFPNASDEKIRPFKRFWSAYTPNLTVVMEAGQKSPHSGEFEGGKNINGAIGLMELLPSLSKLRIQYRLELSSRRHINKRGHLVIDGSPGGNRLSKQLFGTSKTRELLGFENYHCPQFGNRTLKSVNCDKCFHTEYRFVRDRDDDTEKREIVYDYGLVCSIPSPFDKNSNCLILSGNHGYGTFACMRFISDPDLFSSGGLEKERVHFRAIVGIAPRNIGSNAEIEVLLFEDLSQC